MSEILSSQKSIQTLSCLQGETSPPKTTSHGMRLITKWYKSPVYNHQIITDRFQSALFQCPTCNESLFQWSDILHCRYGPGRS